MQEREEVDRLGSSVSKAHLNDEPRRRHLPRFPAEYLAAPEVKLRKSSEKCWFLLRRDQNSGPWRNRRDEANRWEVVLDQETKVHPGGCAGRRRALSWEQEGGT